MGTSNPTEQPLISVLTATFNSLEGLRSTIASVTSQTWSAVDHVVIDGGSTDGTVDYLRSLGTATRWTSEPDDGIADALNKGLAMVKGEWVLVLNAEDTFLEAASLERAVPSLRGDWDIVSFDVLVTGSGVRRRFAGHGFSPRINFKTTIPHQGAFCRALLFDRIGVFDPSLRIGMDYEFFLRAYRARAEVLTVHEILAEMPATGVSSRLDWQSLDERFAEERFIHRRHCPNLLWSAVYSAYWPLYLAYRRSKSRFDDREGKSRRVS